MTSTRSFLIFLDIFCVIPLIIKPLINAKKVLVIYITTRIERILFMSEKSIPVPPCKEELIPTNIVVVACPNILGPIIVKIVPIRADRRANSKGIYMG